MTCQCAADHTSFPQLHSDWCEEHPGYQERRDRYELESLGRDMWGFVDHMGQKRIISAEAIKELVSSGTIRIAHFGTKAPEMETTVHPYEFFRLLRAVMGLEAGPSITIRVGIP